MPVSSLRRFIAVLLLFSFSTLTVQAQQTKPSPDEKQRKVRKELKKAYVDWIDDVDPILTQSERDAWKKLDTDEEREQFIAEVWRSRDPDPDTEENEFKEEFYERVAYANAHFSSGKPGRLTDRGRIHIKFGKPDGIESHPAGGHYERTWAEGGGSTSTYPFERWFYRHIPNVRSGIDLEFVDPTGSGEYRLARNPDEKDALIHIPGAGLTYGELAGIENRANRISNLPGFGLANYRRAQDSPFEVMDLHIGIERDLTVNRNFFGGSLINTPIADADAIGLDTQINSLILAAKLEKMEGGAAIGPFVIGRTKVIPNLTATYRRNEPVGIYLQVYNAAIDQTTLRPAADAEYVLLKNGKEISKQTEDWRQINDAGQRLTLTRLIDSRSLEPGEYQIQVRIRDHITGEVITPSATLTIVP